MSSHQYEYQNMNNHKYYHSQEPIADGNHYADSKAALLVAGGGLLARQSFHHLRKQVIYNSQGLWKDVRHILTFVIKTNARARLSTRASTSTRTSCTSSTSCSSSRSNSKSNSSYSKSGRGAIYSQSFNYFTMNGIHAEDQIDLIRHILWNHHNDQHDPTPRDILPMLLQSLDISSVLPILDMYMKRGNNHSSNGVTTIAATTNSISMPRFYNCKGESLFIELCMDSNHVGLHQLLDALQIILLQLQPQLTSSIQKMNIAANTIATEARNIDYVRVEYMEQFHSQSDEAEGRTTGAERTRLTTVVEDFHLFHTPMQATWESTLYHRDEYMVLDSIHNVNDFLLVPPQSSSSQQKDDIRDLWKTTLYLLHATTGLTICDFATGHDDLLSSSSSSLQSSTSSSFNILHAITKVAHQAHSAVLWFAVRLYKELLSTRDSNGDLPIHIAASNLIYYKSIRTQLKILKKDIASRRLRQQHHHQQPIFLDDGNGKNDDSYHEASIMTSTTNTSSTDTCTAPTEDGMLRTNSAIYTTTNDNHYESSLSSFPRCKHRINVSTINNKNTHDTPTFPEWDNPPIIHLLQGEAGQHTASIPDSKGRLPLHIVLSSHDTNQVQLDNIHASFQHNLGDETDYALFEPAALSLSSTLTSFKPMSNRNGYAMDTFTIVSELVKAYPYSLLCVDPTNGCHPFFAAVSLKTVSLDVVYFLLTQSPDVLLDHSNSTNNTVSTSTRKHHIQALKCPTLNSSGGMNNNNNKKKHISSSQRLPSKKCGGDGYDGISSSLYPVCKRLKSLNNM